MAPIPSPDSRPSLLLASLATRLPAAESIPTRLLRLLKRQQNPAIVPTSYGSITSGPAPGTVVGIVLGSVGGFLLVLWLIYTCMNFNTISSSSSYTARGVVRARKSHGYV